ncbi:hypothetical protein LAG90_08670 [Marinilongibacter aquaticus]|uniref:hypothetical protein n=1 Tax=Marinilongibacter aquaticus TaxID=2975157 RepID=UPI0021BD6564|nr:hypothetical protein [Marinilongibacter aquaticus]UBM60707.1 hypothetical protein LAG90_08670 [Marinilongibacter aquaticus]
MKASIHIAFVFLLAAFSVGAQDLEHLKVSNIWADGLRIVGGLQTEGKYYLPFNTAPRQVPYQYFIAGNVKLSLGKWVAVPASFSFTNQGFSIAHGFYGKNIAQRFNRISLKPYYKRHKLYLGTNALVFTDYTLAGHRFDGLAYEYQKSGKGIYGAVMKGRFLRRVSPLVENGILKNRPTYARHGEAAKLGYSFGKAFVELSYLHGFDKKAEDKLLDSLNVHPEENQAFALKVVYPLGNWVPRLEWARSRISKIDRSEFTSASTHDAFDSGLEYKGKKVDWGFSYSRVNPGFKTFGAYYFNNDLETIATSLGLRFLENKLMTNTKLGLQRSNLDNLAAKKNSNLSIEASLVANPSEKMNVHANFSNFSAFSNFNPTYNYLKGINGYEFIDTLNYRQVNTNLSMGFSVQSEASKKIQKSLSGELIYQTNGDRLGENRNPSNSLFFTLGQQWVFGQTQFQVGYGLNYSGNKNDFGRQTLIGPYANVSKAFFKNALRISNNFVWNFSKNDANRSALLTDYFMLSYKANRSHTTYLKFNLMVNSGGQFQDSARMAKSTIESFFNLGYRYTLNAGLKKKEK